MKTWFLFVLVGVACILVAGGSVYDDNNVGDAEVTDVIDAVFGEDAPLTDVVDDILGENVLVSDVVEQIFRDDDSEEDNSSSEDHISDLISSITDLLG